MQYFPAAVMEMWRCPEGDFSCWGLKVWGSWRDSGVKMPRKKMQLKNINNLWEMMDLGIT